MLQYPAPCISGALIQGIRLALIDWAQPCVGWFYIIVNTGWMPGPVCEKNPQAKVLQPPPKSLKSPRMCIQNTNMHLYSQALLTSTHTFILSNKDRRPHGTYEVLKYASVPLQKNCLLLTLLLHGRSVQYDNATRNTKKYIIIWRTVPELIR